MKSVVLFNDTTTQMHHGCELVMKQIRKKLYERNIKIISYSDEGSDWKKNIKLLAAMTKCHGIIVNGEGTIHHNRPAGKLLLEATTLAEKYNLPCFLINTTYQENPPEFKEYLEKFEDIFVREGASAAELENISVSAHIVPDITLSYDYAPRNKRIKLGFTDSSIEPISQKLYKLCQANDGIFLPVIRSSKHDGIFSVRESLREVKFEITKWLLKLSNSQNYLQKRNLYLKKSIVNYFNEIASCNLVVSGRFHAVCFCILTETPFLAIDGNSHKIQSMIKDMGLSENRLIPAEKLIELSLKESHSFSDEELQALQNFKKIARKRIDEMFDIISEKINNNCKGQEGSQ